MGRIWMPGIEIIVIIEIGKGMKFSSTTARPEMLPTDTWLGTRKKNPAAATMAAPAMPDTDVPAAESLPAKE